jgi:pyruvate formate lyase activating enzyme
VPECPISGSLANLRKGGYECTACGKCIDKCPYAYRKIAGREYTPKELADVIMKNAIFLTDGGGVTFSGGEPTMQSDFMLEVFDLLPLHKAIETCGFCKTETFKKVLDKIDFLFFDIKHTNPEMHKKYTGVDNALILRNLEQVKASGKPFIVRIPMIKGVNDGAENLEKTAELLKDAKNLLRVEILPYNGAAGAKYDMTGMVYGQNFVASKKDEIDISPFTKAGVECKVM